MGNSIKYSEGSESLALNKGNWWIGTGDTNKGPTAESGYWNAINPPSGGYMVYLNKETNGPSIHSISNDEHLISFTNKISGNNYVNVAECLVYYQTQDDKLCVNREYENIVTDGLVLNLDAGHASSYPTSGTTWYDLSGGGNNGTLVNGTIFSGGSMVFDGVDDYVDCGSNKEYIAISGWIKTTTLSSEQCIVSGFIRSTDNVYGNVGIQNGNLVWTRPNKRRYTLKLVNDGVWHHFHVYKDLTNNFIMYIDGIESPFNTSVGSNRTSDVSVIGARRLSGVHSLFFEGDISNVLIYNRILTETEILQNYNAQKGRFGL